MKVSRHAKIIELINQYSVETQEELSVSMILKHRKNWQNI